MKKFLVVMAVAIFLFAHLPASTATDSWIKIEEPTPGIYWHGEKILSIKNAVVMIGMGGKIDVEAAASENVITIYFSLYNLREKNMTASCWDTTKADGWSCSFDVERGIYVLIAAGAAIDINEPVAIDYMIVMIL